MPRTVNRPKRVGSLASATIRARAGWRLFSLVAREPFDGVRRFIAKPCIIARPRRSRRSVALYIRWAFG